MTDFRATQSPIAGLYLIERSGSSDDRGTFERLYSAADFIEFCGVRASISHINRSITYGRGTTRGLHYQCAPHEEIKLVTCLKGKVFDVAVDVRPDSPTYLRHHVVELSEDEPISLLIGKGIAHGFQTLADVSELLYLHTMPYAPRSESRLHVEDPAIGIAWPLEVIGLSELDRAVPYLDTDSVPIPISTSPQRRDPEI